MDWILAVSALLVGLALGMGLMLWLTGGPIIADEQTEQSELPGPEVDGEDTGFDYELFTGRYPMH